LRLRLSDDLQTAHSLVGQSARISADGLEGASGRIQMGMNLSFRSLARSAAIATVACAIVLGVIVFIGPRIGLGAGEFSIFYLWFGLKRLALAALAAAGFSLGLYLTVCTYAKQPGVVVANTAVVLVTLAVSLVFAEVLARFIDGRPVFAVRNWVVTRNALALTQNLVEYDPLLGWVPKPNQRINSDNPASSF
jgi:hypothetical protein